MRESIRRGLLLAALPLLTAGLAACQEGAATEASVGWPPGAAGLACNYLDYQRVEAALGTRFDTAGGARKDDTYTCALTRSDRDLPDLTLAVTQTAANSVIFQATVAPSGATLIKGLGAIAYQLGVPAAANRGPGLELGWLSARGRLMIVRYTFAPDTPADEVTAFGPKLLGLARAIESA